MASAAAPHLDWISAAAFLAEQSDRPVAALDGTGTIRLVNSHFERTLGFDRDEIEGRAWVEVFGNGNGADGWLQLALRGMLWKRRTEVSTRDGRRLVLELQTSLFGSGSDQGLIVSVKSAVPVPGLPRDPSGTEIDFDYRMSSAAQDFGRLLQVAWMGSSAEQPGQRCFEFRYGRDVPCDNCPVRRPSEEPWPRATVRRASYETDRFQVTTAHLENDGVVRIRVRTVSVRDLQALRAARAQELAERARLSDRERAVLSHLLVGASLEAIAVALRISLRTVKFHVGNVLQKLGVDSRIDLIRVADF